MEKPSLISQTVPPSQAIDPESSHDIPNYLQRSYWWAYLHPRAVRVFERQWLVNLILWGNFNRLRDAALDELGTMVGGRTLQVACVYGDFTPKLADRLEPGATLDVIDVAPVQIRNTRRKLGPRDNVRLHQQDASKLRFGDGEFDNTVVFFLLHEQPEEVRRATIAEALRVTRNGGRLVFVDYHRPAPWNPMRHLMTAVFRLLEPFAEDFWRQDIAAWAQLGERRAWVSKTRYFGGLYQKTIFQLAKD